MIVENNSSETKHATQRLYCWSE